MKNNKDLITGFIKTATTPIVFSVPKNEFLFTFMTDSVGGFLGKLDGKESIQMPINDGFIYGKTHQNHNIAIYTGDMDFCVKGSQGLYTNAYVVSDSNIFDTDISNYDGIKFYGKSLNDIFVMKALKVNTKNNTFEYRDDSIYCEFFSEKLKIKVTIRSLIEETFRSSERSIANNNVVLILEFDKEQPLKTFFEHYHNVQELIAFLTYRQNVGFDKISLLKRSGDKEDEFNSIAKVFVKEDNEIGTKDPRYNICFNDIEGVLPNLFSLFYEKDENGTPKFSVGFIPKNDYEINYMSNDRIRTICSSLEYELKVLKDIQVEEDEILKKLIKEVKSKVKEFRNQNIGLSNDTYNLINSNIKNWTLTLNEKLNALLNKHNDEISILNKSNIAINADTIDSFVKHRNTITHNNFCIPTQEVKITAHYMCGLLYCSVLTRLGLSKEVLSNLCEHKLLH